MPQYTEVELLGMNGKRLQEIADNERLTTSTGKPIKWTKSHTIKERVKQIMAARSRRAVDAALEAGGAPGEPTRPANPEFENLCATGTVPDGQGVAVSGRPDTDGGAGAGGSDGSEGLEDNRGGAREGAGRPQGMTAERAAVMKLPDVPNKTIKDSLEALFELWSQATKCPEVALTKDEASDLALHWTRLLHMAGVEQKIPDWASEIVTGMWDTYNMVKIKAATARQAAVTRALDAANEQSRVQALLASPVGS